ncbi:MAG: FtsW/RodA/SpoVE family cell cycle protein [Anaerolineae bacterium]|nr:FtsW/RodA/SpoVE family cell cycle protein [Anaerolineae bacterium]
MNFLYPITHSPKGRIQSRLLSLAALFMLCFSLALTLAPAVRMRSWDVALRWWHWLGFFVWLFGFSLIHRQLRNLLPEHDPYILPIAAFISGWGLLTIYRLSTNFGLRQTLWLAFSLFILWKGLKSPGIIELFKKYKYVLLISGLILTAATFIFGTYPGGAGPRLWLGCCSIYFQPSELLKLLLIIYLAAYLASRLPFYPSLLQILTPTLILVGAALIILLAQRDLGTASIFILLYFVIIYLVTSKRRILLTSLLTLTATALLGYVSFAIIRYRVESWLNPWIDPSGRSYQIIQSLLAVAAGGTFGRGPGLGSPGLVPVAQSDFIFAAIAEETGLTGTIALVAMLALLTGRGLHIALHASNSYHRYLAIGITTYFAGQSILIIGGNLRLLPLTGVTFPFVSYGGSSLLISFIAVMILLWVSDSEDEPAPLRSVSPYILVGGAFLAGFAAIAITNGYWAFLRNSDLLTRTDNPRRSISDRYIYRGALLDRNNQIITSTQGKPGAYTRSLLYPPLSPVVGYTNPTYGQAGLEASLDPYLRGQQGHPAFEYWRSHVLYGLPPSGLDIRLTIDLRLQKIADELLNGKTGAAILMNAQSGEILVMVSHPFFDSNTLSENWEAWTNDPDAPLLNRTTQAQYPPGTAITPFLAAEALTNTSIPQPPINPSVFTNGKYWHCAQEVPDNASWAELLSSGCPGATQKLSKTLSSAQLIDLFHRLGFDQTPTLQLAQAQPLQLPETLSANDILSSNPPVRITPLQMAIAASTLSHKGVRSAPIITLAVHTPHQGWVFLPGEAPQKALPNEVIPQVTELITIPQTLLWQVHANAYQDEEVFTWYLAGTTPAWQGTPLVLVILLEENNPSEAERIGRQILESAFQ